MSLRYSSFVWCETCKRGTPRTVRGGCVVCRRGVRRAKRAVKSSAIGNNVVHANHVRKIAWDLWSVWIRALHETCEMCDTPLPPEALQGAHGWTREDRVIMFHDDNVFALCGGCHRKHGGHSRAWAAWMEEHLGAERYEALKTRATVAGRMRLSDYQLVILLAEQRIAALPAGPRKEWALERQRVIGERMVRLGVSAA